MKLKLITGILFLPVCLFGQVFYFGNDLSYVNMMEDCGAVFKEKGVPKDVYQIFADHGCTLVRVRLWKNPTWQNSLAQPEGVKSQYNDFEDAKECIARSKAAGMKVMLDIHFSDFWADPGHQIIPADWLGVATNTASLGDSVYNYVVRILTTLDGAGLMPEIVKLGNENNSGILYHTILNADYSAGGSVSSSWSRHAALYKKAIQAVRDVSESSVIKPLIALHFSGLKDSNWWFQNIINNGVTDFDILGLSYYYAWHQGSIQDLGKTIRSLKSSFPAYDVMVVETGYLWTTKNFDLLGNIITTPDPAYLPVIPEKQLEYLVDYTREVMRSGGNGVIFWEPAWVSTPCRNPWGVGSSQDHVVFFDPVNTNFMENGGGRWCEPEFYLDINEPKVTFKIDMTGQDVSKGVFISGTWTGDSMRILPMANEGNMIYSYFTYLSPGDSGCYFFLNGANWDSREPYPVSCTSEQDTGRSYLIGQNDIIYSCKWTVCYPAGMQSKKYTEFKSDYGIELYPNPVVSEVYIRISDFENIKSVNLFGINGAEILTSLIPCGSGHFKIDVRNVPDGVYYLKIQTGEAVIAKRLIIFRNKA